MTLHATIAPTLSTATVAGMVRFKDGANDIGNATIANGSASMKTSTLGVGPHMLTAVFTSTVANVTGSTSERVIFQVDAPATAAKTASGATPGFPAAGSTTETHKATVTPAPSPLVDQPRADQSPAEQSPAEQSPAEQSPVQQPPAQQSPGLRTERGSHRPR